MKLLEKKVKGRIFTLSKVKGGYLVRFGGKVIYDTRKFPQFENNFGNAQTIFYIAIDDFKRWG